MDKEIIEKNIIRAKLKNANKINPRLREIYLFLVQYEYYEKFNELI